MAITISGQNNNDRILASDGVLDSISGFNVVGVMTAAQFDVTGKTTTNHLNIGSNIQIGNAGIITATTLIGNVTGNINHTSNLLLQISGSEKFRVGNGGQFGIAGANYGTAGQVLTSGGSGSAPTWSTINSDKITEGNTEAEVVDTGSDGHFKVTTEGSERLRVSADGNLTVGAAVTISPVGNINATGIVTASAFKLPDGSNVGGVESDAQENTLGGTNAGDSFSGTSALKNTLFGYDAGTAITTADVNTALGHSALKTNTQSSYNVAIGYESLKNFDRSDAGGQNTAVGWQSGDAMTSGRYNSLLGGASGGDITDGEQNSCFGYAAGRSITSGFTNTCIGYGAGKDSNQTGNNNIIIGNDAESSSTSVSNEITLGDSNISLFRVPGINLTFGNNGAVIAGVVTATSFSGDGSNLTGLSGVSVANQADNRLITATGTTDALNGEVNLTWSGTDFKATGAGGVTLRAGSTNAGGAALLLDGDSDGDWSGATYAHITHDTSGHLNIMSRNPAGNANIIFGTNDYNAFRVDENRHIRPESDNARDLGTSSYRWRNLYTTDLQLSNKGSQNDVDGTWGDWTLQEGENKIFMINNRTGKKYSLKMEEE